MNNAANPVIRIGLINSAGHHMPLNMRRTDRDRQPPREVVTAVFLGDPAPGRVVPQIQDPLGYYRPAEVTLPRMDVMQRLGIL